MINLQTPSQPRIPIGSVKLPNGTVLEITINDEWARYFYSLNSQVVSSASLLEQMLQRAAMLPDGGETSDEMPGPPGPRGLQGEAGPALFLLDEGDADNAAMLPPSIDNIYIPLAQKDAVDGVPALTAFKLNLKNVAGTFTNFFTSVTTAVRTWTMPDKSGTVALLVDFAAPPAIGNTTPEAGAFTTLTALATAVTDLTAGSTSVGTLAATDVTVSTVAASGGFGCNGKSPQGPKVSGGTLAGVTAALVANGILSS